MTASAWKSRPRHLYSPRRVPAEIAFPRGLGLAIGAVVSLAMWAGLISLALAVFGG